MIFLMEYILASGLSCLSIIYKYLLWQIVGSSSRRELSIIICKKQKTTHIFCLVFSMAVCHSKNTLLC
uniref:Putative ovule protein n=1 Tax=Solanum chacoense TaxID=4108 RepID=A0A0V0GS33_SOLCH